MDFYFDSSSILGVPLYDVYAKNALALIRNLERDKSLSQFERFNKRFKIAWGMKIEFTDNLRITQEATRNCYEMMLKLSDLWFAFEHLVKTVADVFPKDKALKSKVDLYKDETLEKLGFVPITYHFNQLLWERVLAQSAWRRDMYPFLAYLKNNTFGTAQNGISDSIGQIKIKQGLSERQIFSLAYGIRNLYVHEGVAAALGGRNYKVKECFYTVLYDTLVLYSLALGNAYCEQKLASFNQ